MPMRTARAIAFRERLETCTNNRFKLLEVFRRERCGRDEEGLACEARKYGWYYSTYCEKLDEMMIVRGPRFALYDAGQDWRVRQSSTAES